MLMMEKISKAKYEYTDIPMGENQYANIDFKNTLFVDAKYTHAMIPSDRGNRYIEALPPPRTEQEILQAYSKPILTYDFERESNLPDSTRLYMVGQLRSLRLPLPFHKELEQSFRLALEESYRNRYTIADEQAKLEVTVADVKQGQHNKLVGDNFSSANAGFSLLGCSGCGKSSSLKILLSQYPQVIMHHDDKYGRYPQIVYLVVNCVANSNFSALYASIGNAIDRALGITTSVYQKLIESRRSLGEKAEKVRELVEIFAIGIIILDEIQLIDFQSTKENSFESLMTLTNRTKVAIAVVGTEDAYSKMFTHLRTARRLGNIISGNLYCENRTYFSILAKRVFKYQWFDSPVEMTNDMLEALYRNTHGIIDRLVGLCMYLNLDYISSKSRPTIDADYINKVAKRHYRGIQKLMDELDDPLNEKKRQKIIEEADRKLDNLLQEHKQTAFAEKIMESAEADEKKIPLKRNIIHNIEMVVADYTSDRIAAAVDRVLISTDETDEKVLTRVVMKLLTDSEKETPTKKQKSKKKPLQTSDMVKFIIE